MEVNLLEIDYMQLCFSILDQKYFISKNSIKDLIFYQDEINIEKLRYNFSQKKLDYDEWSSFKIKITDIDTKNITNQICSQLNFTITPKIKIQVKLKQKYGIIIKCLATISKNDLGNDYEINIARF